MLINCGAKPGGFAEFAFDYLCIQLEYKRNYVMLHTVPRKGKCFAKEEFFLYTKTLRIKSYLCHSAFF